MTEETLSQNEGVFGERTIPVYDLSRVEVVKGPQPTYFGEGAVGGSIRYISADPSLTELQRRVRAEVSTTEGSGGANYIIDGSIGGPIIRDMLGVRLTVWNRSDDGFIDNVTTGQDDVNSSDFTGVRLRTHKSL